MTKKKKPDRKNVNDLVSDFGPPERARQDGGIITEPVDRNTRGKVIQTRARAKITCKLDWYFDARTIDSQMWHAGARFSLLYFTAGKVPRVTVALKERIKRDPRLGDYDEWLNNYTVAQQKLTEAYGRLNEGERDVVREVAGLDNYAGTPGRVRTLCMALRALAVFWHIPTDIRAPFLRG